MVKYRMLIIIYIFLNCYGLILKNKVLTKLIGLLRLYLSLPLELAGKPTESRFNAIILK